MGQINARQSRRKSMGGLLAIRLIAVFTTSAFIASIYDIAMVCNAIEQDSHHFDISKNLRLLAKA